MTLVTTEYRNQVKAVLPRYELIEARLIQLWGERLGATFQKPPDHTYKLDAFSPDLLMWVEVKFREYPSDAFNTLRFDVDKLEAGIQKVQLLGHKFVLLCAFVDRVKLFYQYRAEDAAQFTYTMEGRENRSEHEKVKPMAEIPVSLFARW